MVTSLESGNVYAKQADALGGLTRAALEQMEAGELCDRLVTQIVVPGAPENMPVSSQNGAALTLLEHWQQNGAIDSWNIDSPEHAPVHPADALYYVTIWPAIVEGSHRTLALAICRAILLEAFDAAQAPAAPPTD
jgi:hypothetical protein